MGQYLNPKIVGATIVGFALVAGAYVTSGFLAPGVVEQTASLENTTRPMQRQPIAVVDSDNNGLEDWRDTFVDNEINASQYISEEYSLPDTLTGQTGVGLMEGMISSRVYAPFGSTDEELINKSVESLKNEAAYTFYDTKDIEVLKEWEDEDIVNYANTMAAIIIYNNNPELDNAIEIFDKYLREKNENDLDDLKLAGEIFKNYRDDSLRVPVPDIFIKTHLDLINTYNAVYEDISAFATIDTDPLLSLLHIKRYPQDAEAITLALENMYEAVFEYSNLFDEEDPAILFLIFSPDYQNNL